MEKEIWAYIAGFVFAVFVGHFATKSIIDAMWTYIDTKNPDEPKLVRYHGQQQIVGVVERTLYFGSLLFNQAVFIAVWLTLKTVSRSTRWTDTGPVPGRAVFQPFLAGTGLSLLFAGGGYAITFFLKKGYANSEELALSIFVALIAVWLTCYYFSKAALRQLPLEKAVALEAKKVSKKSGKHPNSQL